jgi:hypothetical protein
MLRHSQTNAAIARSGKRKRAKTKIFERKIASPENIAKTRIIRPNTISIDRAREFAPIEIVPVRREGVL